MTFTHKTKLNGLRHIVLLFATFEARVFCGLGFLEYVVVFSI